MVKLEQPKAGSAERSAISPRTGICSTTSDYEAAGAGRGRQAILAMRRSRNQQEEKQVPDPIVYGFPRSTLCQHCPPGPDA